MTPIITVDEHKQQQHMTRTVVNGEEQRVTSAKTIATACVITVATKSAKFITDIMMMFQQILREERAMSEVAVAMEQRMQRHGQFNGKGVSCYKRDYMPEML